LKKYAILCLPRCGSRYLAVTLSNAGVGAPREHAMTTFEYAAIRDSPDDIVARLCEKMQVKPDGLQRASAPAPIVMRDQSSTYAAFGQRLNALIDGRSRQLVEKTIERLCERTALERRTAEKLAYAHSSAFAP
jgi:LPS sulfotransferase NodH